MLLERLDKGTIDDRRQGFIGPFADELGLGLKADPLSFGLGQEPVEIGQALHLHVLFVIQRDDSSVAAVAV